MRRTPRVSPCPGLACVPKWSIVSPTVSWSRHRACRSESAYPTHPPRPTRRPNHDILGLRVCTSAPKAPTTTTSVRTKGNNPRKSGKNRQRTFFPHAQGGKKTGNNSQTRGVRGTSSRRVLAQRPVDLAHMLPIRPQSNVKVGDEVNVDESGRKYRERLVINVKNKRCLY